MAGGILRSIGAVLLVLGAALFLVGMTTLAVVIPDERENQDQLLTDEERSDQNEAMFEAGLVMSALGVITALVSVVFFVMAGARKERARKKHELLLAETAETLVIADGKAHSGVVSVRADAGTAAAAPVGPVNAWMAAAAVLGAVLLVLVTLMVAGAIGSHDAAASDGSTRPYAGGLAAMGVLQGARVDGNATEGPAHTATWLLDVPEGATGVAGKLRFEAGPADPGAVRAVLEVAIGQHWEPVALMEGPTGLVVEWSNPGLDERQIRLRVEPVEDGAVAYLEIRALVLFWADA